MTPLRAIFHIGISLSEILPILVAFTPLKKLFPAPYKLTSTPILFILKYHLKPKTNS
jgi:hypothetical protein